MACLAAARDRRSWRSAGPHRRRRRLDLPPRPSIGMSGTAMAWSSRYVGVLMLMIWGMLVAVGREIRCGCHRFLGSCSFCRWSWRARSGLGWHVQAVLDQASGIITFVAIRPLTSGQIVFAKFLMAAHSALLTWAISLVFPALVFPVGQPRQGDENGARFSGIYSGRRRSRSSRSPVCFFRP